MPVTQEQIEPYSTLIRELTQLYRTFRIIRGISPSRNMEIFIERKAYLRDAITRFFTELIEARTILDESHVEILDGLVNEAFYYLSILEQLNGVGVEDEQRIRQSHLNELEERLDDRFILAEATIRRFLLGFSFRAWWQTRKIKSRRK
ncbi:MAG: hypothetical protein RX318_07765 [bacterium]|nr:hypothetical protein [bacterium]